MQKSLSELWQEKLKQLSIQNIENEPASTIIAASQFIFNPLEDDQIVVSNTQQYEPAILTLGRKSRLEVSITSTQLKLWNLFAFGTINDKGAKIKNKAIIKEFSCVIRPYHNNVPSNNVNLWILLPLLYPSIEDSISIVQANDVQRSYNLVFEVEADESGCVAYFGSCGFQTEEAIRLIMGIYN